MAYRARDSINLKQNAFLFSEQARNLRVDTIAQLDDDSSRRVFAVLRWPESNGQPICPRCNCLRYQPITRGSIYRCKSCLYEFSETSGTIFGHTKKSMNYYLKVIAFFFSEKGGSPTEMMKHVGCTYKSAFDVCGKMRFIAQEIARDASSSKLFIT